MSFSRNLTFCFLLLTASLQGCSTNSADDMRGSFSDASLKTGALVQRYGQIIGAPQKEYLKSLEYNLKSHLPKKIGRDYEFRIILLDAKRPMAYSPGAGFIIISRGMITALTSEAQLAFVLAHEMSHYYLQHNFAEIEDESAPDPALEISADKMAAGILAFAGYDPYQGLEALKNIYKNAAIYLADSPSHPDYLSRATTLSDEIKESGWKGPGIIDRRDFKRFRSTL